MAYKSPDLDQLRDMLNMLVGDSLAIAAVDAMASGDVSHTAVYVDDSDVAVASCSVDMASAARLGAVLSMIPPAGADGMVEDGELSKMANDNLYEVMNIFSSLFMDDKSSHLRLERVDAGPDSRIAGEIETVFEFDMKPYGSVQVAFNAV